MGHYTASDNALFHNLWSVWLAIACVLLLITLVLTGQNLDQNEDAVWGAVLAPLYTLFALFFCMIGAVCCSHRSAFSDDPDRRYVTATDRSLRALCPALLWNALWASLALASIIALNVRLDALPEAPNDGWGVFFGLGLAFALSFALYWCWAGLVQCAYIRAATPPPAWTRCVDVFVCCLVPRGDYDDDDSLQGEEDAAVTVDTPATLRDQDSDAPLLLYECSPIACCVHSGYCLPAIKMRSRGGSTSRALGVLLLTTAALYLLYLAALVSFGLGLPFASGNEPSALWQVLLVFWIGSLLTLGAASLLVCVVSSLTRHRYAAASTLVLMAWLVGVLVTSLLVAFLRIDPETSSFHLYLIPLYIVTPLAICFFTCSVYGQARTGAVRSHHGYHLVDATSAVANHPPDITPGKYPSPEFMNSDALPRNDALKAV